MLFRKGLRLSDRKLFAAGGKFQKKGQYRNDQQIDDIIAFIENAGDYDAVLAAAYVAGVAQGWPDFSAPSLSAR